MGVKVRFGFGLGIIFLTFKTFGNNFKISHRKAPLPISSAARLDVRKDTEVPDPCVSYVSVLFFYDGLEVLPKISLFVGIKSPLRYIPAVEPFSEKK